MENTENLAFYELMADVIYSEELSEYGVRFLLYRGIQMKLISIEDAQKLFSDRCDDNLADSFKTDTATLDVMRDKAKVLLKVLGG